MSPLLLVLAGWVVLSVPVALLIGGGIAVADRKVGRHRRPPSRSTAWVTGLALACLIAVTLRATGWTS